MRLIDADKLIEELDAIQDSINKNKRREYIIERTGELIITSTLLKEIIEKAITSQELHFLD